jgi:hypothetical protein
MATTIDPRTRAQDGATRRWRLSWRETLGLFLLVALLAWGSSVALAAGAAPSADGPVQTMGPVARTLAAGGSDFVCGVRDDLTLTCWGRATLDLTDPPTGRYGALAAGRRDVCALAIDATMACWGRWYDRTARLGEAVVAPAGRFVAVDVADTQACAVHTDGSLACWGAWQLQGPAQTDVPPSGTFTAVAVVHDWYGGCAIRTDGTLACWGPDTWGERTPPQGGYRAIAAGRQMYCAIGLDDRIACWGRQLYGMGEPPKGRYRALAIGGDTGCAIRADGVTRCWGAAAGGSPLPPVGSALPPDDPTAAVSVVETIAALIGTDGRVRQWGETLYWTEWGFGSPDPAVRFAIHHVLPDEIGA